MKRKTRSITLLLLTALACAALALPFIPRARALGLRSLALVGPSGVSGWSGDRLEAMGSEGTASLGLIAADPGSCPEQRVKALIGLRRMGAEAAPATRALADVLVGDPDPGRRTLAAFALNKIDSQASAVLEPERSRSAAMVLGRMGAEAAAAGPALIGALGSDPEDVRRQARSSLAYLGITTLEDQP